MPFARRSVAFEIEGDKQAWFYTMYLLCLTGLLGITITGDAFNAFVFLEVSSLSTYVLIAMGRDRRALLASYQYLIMGTIGATFYVIGVGLLYLVTGSLNMVDIASRLGPASVEQLRPIVVALAFLTVGISLKLALFPLHVWLPNAYAYAPSFATAFLAATATKVAVYLFLRIFFSDLRRRHQPGGSPRLRRAARAFGGRDVRGLDPGGVRAEPEAHAGVFVGRADRLHHLRHQPRQPERADGRHRASLQSCGDEGRAVPRARCRGVSRQAP